MSQLSGTVASAELCAPLEGVRVRAIDPSGKFRETTMTDKRGEWNLLKTGPGTALQFSKEGFVEKEIPGDSHPDLVRLLENRLLGYHDKLWFAPGETARARIHSSVPHTAALYRHGSDKRIVLDLGENPPSLQTVPDGHFVESGVGWRETLAYQIPEDAEPGLYSLLLTAEGQEDFAVPLVVSTPPERRGEKTRLLVLASTNNWQLYNIWGGRSRYRNFETKRSPDFMGSGLRVRQIASRLLPGRILRSLKSVAGKQKPPDWTFQKLAVQRPHTNCLLEGDSPDEPFCNHLAAGEWRVLAWLERQGIPYDIVTGFELHQRPETLDRYRAILLNTHCEYWTREMFEAVKRRHENNGLWIVNASGNTMYRQSEFLDDGSARCVSVAFHESCADETQLTGVRFTESDYGTCAPYKALLPEHWVFEGVQWPDPTHTFGRETLNRNTPKLTARYDPGRPGLKTGLSGSGASGWETDKLSPTAPPGVQVVAKGQNPHGGADMAVRDPEGGRGGFFSASSITFGGAPLVDPIASRVLQNVLARALLPK